MNLTSNLLDKHIAKIKNTFTSGSKDQAIAECQNLVFYHPKNTLLRKLLANLLVITGKPLQAAKQLEIGFEFNPDDEELLFNLCISYRQALSFEESIRYLLIYTQKYPLSADGWGCLSESQFQLQQFHQALDSSSKAISLSDKDSRLFYNRAKIYRALKKYEFSQNDLKVAMQIHANNLSYVMEYAEITHVYEGKKLAKPYFERVIQLKATDYLELLNQGKAFYELGYLDQSIAIYQQIIGSNQLLELAHLNLGSAYYVLRRYPEALANYHQVLVFNNNSLAANINIANTLQAQNLFKESMPFIERALEIDPSSAFAYKLKAQAYANSGFDERILCNLLLAESFDPTLESLQGFLLYSKLEICDWSDINARKERLQNDIKSFQTQVLPFQATLFFDLPELHQISAQQFINANFPLSRHPQPSFNRVHKDKLKIAYISPDFGQHPIAYLTAELFELHDRNHFEIIGVSLTTRSDDSYRSRIKNSVDHWVDISHLSDTQALNYLRSLEIDIAIDLCGHTQDFRLSLWAHRIAPIQMSYLGYLGTMGCAQYYDYLIADQVLIPNEFRAFYDEKIIYLPNYQMNDRHRPRNNHLISKSSLGIPKNHFVFACLNNSFKYQPEIFAAWMQILSDTPNSSIVLFGKNHLVSENLSAQAIKANIDPNRIIFFNSVDYETYLSRLNCIDLFLDTTIYNAGTTASDALWMGIPVITCIGRSFSARMAASVLVAAGMPNLITQSLTDYIQLAIELASDQAKYQAIKTQLIDNSVACKLFDSPATTRNLERAYQLVWDNYLNHVPPEDLVISTSPVSGP